MNCCVVSNIRVERIETLVQWKKISLRQCTALKIKKKSRVIFGIDAIQEQENICMNKSGIYGHTSTTIESI
ncbi:CLUMA_CG016092, isoform A [Clunio marinus]|uniref:CLUMA_CG016092, isoform A n=1 Tax=Clunio marinus TaxID=568069 RepID=A0A1J1IR56_9DIPT|nr:CLUMA_CG016092, isoform A [Clunio marinus]